MSTVSTHPAFAAFLDEVRRILPHLYDPLMLRDSPLLTLLTLQHDDNPATALRAWLIAAIQALRPGDAVPIHSSAWRIYHILNYRYVEQSTQRTVANNIGLSERQLRRQERKAEEALASYVWEHYDLEKAAENMLGVAAAASLYADEMHSTPDGRTQELEWVRQSFPSQVIDVAVLIEAALKTIAPLIQALEVQVTLGISANLPPVMGQQALLRQALLSLLTAAVHSAPGGKVHIAAARQPEGMVMYVKVEKREVAVASYSGVERIAMARQCIELFGGELVTHSAETEGDASHAVGFKTTLLLPISEPLPVLVIDDNLDTLHLFRRYLSGSPYQFHGVHEPEEALAVAAAVRPQAIVLDVMLPQIDGWELLGRLREHPLTRALPIIICTVMPQEQLALALGAAAYLRKPVSREQLLSTLDQHARSRTPKSD